MRIIIAGAGEIGSHLAKILSNDKHDIVVIENDEERIQQIDSSLDVLAIKGSATSFSVLLEAKVKNADLFIGVAQSQEVNITASILAKKLGAKKTVARIDNKEFLFPFNKHHLTSLGIDALISPERLAAKEIIELLNQAGTSEIFDFSDGKLFLVVVKLEENALVIGKTLLEVDAIDKSFNYRAVAISRDGKTIIPRGEDKFCANDHIYVITNQSGIKNILKYSGKKPINIHNVMILGGSRIGRKTARNLQGHVNVKLIDKDKNECMYLADTLEKSLIINGDGTDISLLKEEGIKNMDAFIAVTGNSETNILSCLLAKKMGVKKTIAEIENIDYIEVAENIGIDTIINKKLIAASYISRFTMKTEVTSLICLTGNSAEVLEFVVQPKAKITKTTLNDMHFPKDAIIGGVVRGKKSFIAKGDTQIEENDKVVVFALSSAIHKIEKYFK